MKPPILERHAAILRVDALSTFWTDPACVVCEIVVTMFTGFERNLDHSVSQKRVTTSRKQISHKNDCCNYSRNHGTISNALKGSVDDRIANP